MSSAEIVAVELAAVGAALALSAALGGTGLALEGLGNLASLGADWLQAKADSRQAELDQIRRYEQLVCDVLDRHARIDALSDAVRRAQRDHGARAAFAVPEPLRFEGQPPADLQAWCARIDDELASAEETLSQAIAQAMATELMATATGGISAGQRRLVSQTGAPAGLGAPDKQAPDERAVLTATLTRVLSRLVPDAAQADVLDVRAAAARVTEAATAASAQSRLTDVRIRVQRANTRARTAREDAVRAARCLRLLTGYQAPGADAVRAGLTDVVAGRRRLDESLEAEATRLTAAAQTERERRYLGAALSSALSGLGYQIGEGFETLTARDGEVFMTRGDWPAHAVKLKLGDDQQLRFAMVRTKPPASRQDRQLDAEREQAWCRSFEQVRAAIARCGVRTRMQWRLEPGTQQLPVAAVGPARPEAASRHRERER